MPRLESSQTMRSLCTQVPDSLNRFLQQPDVDVLTFETVIVIEPVRADERQADNSILCDDLFVSFGTDFLAQFGELGPSVTQRDDVFRFDCHHIFCLLH